ncbi:MAG: CopG family transcriptional regulator [Dehalococcoidia bacterium]
MKKTSVYLGEEDEARLKRLAERLGLSRADVIRLALSDYERACTHPRRFAHFDSGSGDGRSVADIPDEELLRGFGE